jgi:hypothetical protein
MTTETRPLFGQQLGAAQLATRALLDRLLAEQGTDFAHWAILNTLGSGAAGPPLDADALADLTAAGRVTATPALTPAGEERYRELRTTIVGLSARVIADVPPDDLETARRVLVAIADTANALVGEGT